MKTHSVSIHDWNGLSTLLIQAADFPYAFIRCLSEVRLGLNNAAFNADELLEARFFGPEGELRIYRDGEALRAVTLSAEDGDETLDEHYKLPGYELPEHSRFGRALTVRKILAFDEDGQAYVRATLLRKWEG